MRKGLFEGERTAAMVSTTTVHREMLMEKDVDGKGRISSKPDSLHRSISNRGARGFRIKI